jgi:hypothetical protein
LDAVEIASAVTVPSRKDALYSVEIHLIVALITPLILIDDHYTLAFRLNRLATPYTSLIVHRCSFRRGYSPSACAR